MERTSTFEGARRNAESAGLRGVARLPGGEFVQGWFLETPDNTEQTQYPEGGVG